MLVDIAAAAFLPQYFFFTVCPERVKCKWSEGGQSRRISEVATEEEEEEDVSWMLPRWCHGPKGRVST